jgi:hypothetical protein
MPKTNQNLNPQPTGWVGSIEEIEELQSRFGSEIIEESWGGPGKPWFEWQKVALTCTADEIGLFGGKSGGKSVFLRAWLVSGNPTEPDEEDIVNKSYIYHPDYLGLILRKNEKDLVDFILRAAKMWGPLGGEYVNGYFRFPAYTKDGMQTSQLGARIDCGHMKDSSAWQKYIGTEYQRVAIDEAPLIADYSLIEELRSCMRTPHAKMRIQIAYAGNAGGPGTGWILDRFMRVRDKEGNIIPHDTVITEDWEHPFTKQIVKRTRIWVFSTIADNTVMRDTPYAVTLISLTDPKMRAAYFEGRWDALFGSYFGDLFRPDGPKVGEPKEACHVITKSKTTNEYPTSLRPWWPISMGGDWGYDHDAAFLWARKTPDKQVIVYREFSVNRTLPERLGVEIARLTKPDLEKLPSHSITLHLGHDAFANKTGDRTIAELIAAGIAKVLGPGSVYLPDILIKRLKETWEADANNWTDQRERDKAIDQIRLHRRQGITIKIAEKTGIIGWQYCRESLRFEPTIASNVAYDERFAQRLLQADPKAFEEYSKLYRDIKPEVLPKLQILDCCPQLIDAIPKTQHEEGTENVDKKHFRGKDIVDTWLYLSLGMEDENPQEPYEVYRDRKLEEVMRSDVMITVNDLVRVNMMLESEWKDKDKGLAPYTPPRQARARHLLRLGKLKRENYGVRSI